MLHILDVSGFVYRAYHTTQAMVQHDNPVNAVYGFCKSMVFLTKRHIGAGDGVVAVFDPRGRRAQHRVKMFKGYKANRPPPPKDLSNQFSMVREAAAEFGLHPVEPIEDVEADDLIASYTSANYLAGGETRIHSSDKDLKQLVGERVEMWDHLKHELVDQAAVEAQYKIPPYRMRDLLALMGDKTDNVPGIQGVGPKTAAEWINKYGGVEDIIANADKLNTARMCALVKANADNARLSLDLVTLKDDCHLPVPLADLRFAGHAATLYDYLERMRFPSIVRELEKP